MTNDSVSWEPVLEGARAEDARTIVEGIARELEHVTAGADLASGSCGLAVFFSYLAALTDDDARWSDVALHHLVHATLHAPATLHRPGLWNGHVGVGWTIEHLTGEEEVDVNAELDKLVLHWLANELWGDEYDLISGLAGIALYSLARLPRPEARTALGLTVQHLSKTASAVNGGISWLTRPMSATNQAQRGRTPNGHLNLGVAHGVPAVVNILARLVRAGIEPVESERLLQGGAAWLLAQCRQYGDALPYWVDLSGTSAGTSRAAWCYGALGVSGALYSAGSLVGEPSWLRMAESLAEAAANRTLAATGVVDAGICHGAVGLAQIYQRFYNATRRDLFREAAVRWIADGMARRHPIGGVLSFPSWNPGTESYVSDPGMLSGAAGVGLVLLSAIGRVRPAWDELMLIDVDGR